MTGDPLDVHITREAEGDLESIHRHYAEEAGSPQAADRIVSAVLDAAESLALFHDR